MSKYDQRLESLIARRTPIVPVVKAARFAANAEQIVETFQASPVYEVYRKMTDHGSAVRYAVGAMQPVNPGYTKVTYGEGDRIQNQLEKALTGNLKCQYEYQGSVTNNTHIKAHSDIDLLAIIQAFVTLELPQKPSSPYLGDPIEELRRVRSTSAEHLKSTFPKAKLDNSGGKAIAISGGSLRRKIDVVPANWYNTNAYASSQAKRFRAVQVLDVKNGKRFVNTPFMHNYRIMKKDERVRGGMRKATRLLKSLKYDSDAVDLSSYDIAALAYNMDDHELLTAPGLEIRLIVRTKVFLDEVARDSGLRETLMVPDESRCIFESGHATVEGLNQLRTEIDDLVYSIGRNLSKDFSKLEAARVGY